MSPEHKPLVWLKGEIVTPPFSESGRIQAGYLLRRLQSGEMLSLRKRQTKPRAMLSTRAREE